MVGMMKFLNGFAITVFLAVSGSASANLLVNGDFESMPNFGSGVSNDSGFSALTGAQIPGWTIEAGHAATVHNTNLYPTISGTYSVNMDGEGFNGVNANLFQDFFMPGNFATLTFDWSTWNLSAAAKLDVSILDLTTITTLASFNTSADNLGIHNESLSFAVNAGDMLRLRVMENPQSGFNDNIFMVDNFSVTAVPEPASMLVLAGGAIALIRRRRK
jgi:hypothetical protein